MKKGKWIWLAVALIAFSGACGCFFAYWQNQQNQKNAKEEYEQLREEAAVTPTETPVVTEKPEETKKETPKETPKATATPEPVEVPIDFAVLQEENPDIYAWIRIEGTTVDYPVLQSETDNAYYLDHTPQHSAGYPGSIYTENYNQKDFSDPVTVVYGHNMNDKSMFGGLHQYADNAFMSAHQDILIYTPDAIRTYRIFSAGITDDSHILLSHDFDDKDVYQSYLDDILLRRDMSSVTDDSLKVTSDDRILILSTCDGANDYARYLVQAVLIDEKR